MVLHFHDGVDEVYTSAWTARKHAKGTEIAFVWGASEINWFDSATGVYRCVLPIAFADFSSALEHGNIIHLL